MAKPYAFVTLITSDSYLPGALTLAAALKDVHPNPPVAPEVEFQTVCLVTPETVDVTSIKLLRRAFNVVIGVELIEHENQRGLQLLGRSDLTTVLTKLHVFRLTQYKKVIFLDADVLPTRPLSHLFSLNHEFSAVPDVGWPDIFNSGLMALTPNEAHFTELMELSKNQGSWDGGDQGLLNEWRGDEWHRLSFTYNTTPTAVYTYAPAYERFGSKISAIHFIGPNKPWANIPWRAPGSVEAQNKASEPLQVYDYASLVDRWYAVYDKHYRSIPVDAAAEYASRRYESAWDQETSLGADLPVASAPSGPSNTLNLEDLRRMAIEGFSGPSYAQTGEGTYLRMPLEGRFDLMRPRTVQTEITILESDGPASPSADDHFFEDGAAPSTAWVHQQPLQPGQLPGAHGYATHSDQPYDIAQGAPFGYTAGAAHDFPWSSDSHSDIEGPLPHLPPHLFARGAAHDVAYTHHGGAQAHHHHGGALAHRGGAQAHHGGAQAHQGGTQAHHHRGGGPAHHGGSQGHHNGHHNGGQGHHGGTHTHFSAQQHHDASRPSYGRRRSSHLQRYPPQSSASEQEVDVDWHAPPESSQGHRYGQSHEPPPPVGFPVHPGQEYTRPTSPPMMLWNPALEPPPNTIPISGFPSQTYFPNVWDQSSQDHARTSSYFTPPPPAPLFEPPPPGQIPQRLLEEKQYAQVLGDSPTDKAVPNPSRIKAVFPWEESPRHVPARVFPQGDAPPPGSFIPQQRQRQPTASSLDSPSSFTSQETLMTSPQQRMSPLSPPKRPLTWTNLGYKNTWDTVPSIQKYASRLVRSPNTQPLQPALDVTETKKGRRMRYGVYESGNTSAEGDDEETTDEERDPVEREHDLRRRSRSGSVTTKTKKEYRSQGVQTIRPEMRDAAVQVATISARTDTDAPEKGQPTTTNTTSTTRPTNGMRSRQTSFVSESGTITPGATQGSHGHGLGGVGGRSSPRPASRSGSTSPPVATHPRVRQAQVQESFIGQTQRASPASSPTGGASPRLARSPRGSQIDVTRTLLDQAPRRPMATESATPPQRVRPVMPAITRSMSMGSDSLSTPSTVGPPRSPEDDFTPLPRERKSSRVWDPARGVDIFKKGSEEVLSRFLRMGSWEDEARRAAS